MPTRKQKQIGYEQKIIAYIDILGFKEIVKKSEIDESQINTIYEALNFLKGREKSEAWNLELVEIEESAQYKGVKNFEIQSRTQCTCFSDTIVVSVGVGNDNVNESITTLIANLSYVGTKLMSEGILLRGGITIGNLIHNESGIIMGQGLIDAYALESNVAKYPRIILSDKLIAKMNYPIMKKSERYPYHQYLQRFDDGCVGFHQMIYWQVLEPWVKMNSSTLKGGLDQLRKIIINGLDYSFEHPDVYEKYKWLKEEYEALIILTKGAKKKIHKLNEGLSGHNIHEKYTDTFYNSKTD